MVSRTTIAISGPLLSDEKLSSMRSSIITEIAPASTALCLFLPHGHMFTNICMAAFVALYEIWSSKIWTTSVKTAGFSVIICIGSATSRMFLRSKILEDCLRGLEMVEIKPIFQVAVAYDGGQELRYSCRLQAPLVGGVLGYNLTKSFETLDLEVSGLGSSRRRRRLIPVETITGSFMISREMGQRKKGGISISSSINPPEK
ncbi:unnamed protein product [Thlaspi arvense]|uniref:Uncharacterized protein n=1 Tax=Thlaspi arvense TaxID=13288 RepID=A0AAU9SAZ8_THLAR|nr:unnamed protein product [Thlaspi arvense]